jgi:hypothetical protein
MTHAVLISWRVHGDRRFPASGSREVRYSVRLGVRAFFFALR